MSISSIEALIEDFRSGKFIIIMDDEARENEGDIMLSAQFATPDKINFMIRNTSGILCVAINDILANKLDLPLMVNDSNNNSNYGTRFTVSVEAASGVTTGVSAYDRAKTIATMVDKKSTKDSLSRPGHMFPLLAHKDGVLGRAGHTESAVEFANLADLKPATVLSEVMNPNGTMAKYNDLKHFSALHGIKIGTVKDLIEYRQNQGEKIKEANYAL